MGTKINQHQPMDRRSSTDPLTSKMIKGHAKNMEKAKEKEISQADELILSSDSESVTYKKPDTAMIKRLQEEAEKNYRSLKDLVKELLESQGISLRSLGKGHDKTVVVDEKTREKARAAIEEGGPLSVEHVSDRIVQFAIALTGGDKSRLGVLREAIDKGFKEAKCALGGCLPDITKETYSRIMEKLDKWEKEEGQHERISGAF